MEVNRMIFSVISVKSLLLASVDLYITRGIVFSTEMNVSAIVNDVSTRICEKRWRIHEVTHILCEGAEVTHILCEGAGNFAVQEYRRT